MNTNLEDSPEAYIERNKPCSFDRNEKLYLANQQGVRNQTPTPPADKLTDINVLRIQTANRQTRNTLSIDLDGVIAKEHHLDFGRKTTDKKIVERMWALQEKGWRIVINTARMDMDVDITKEWLLKNNVPYSHIIFNKPLARYYVDDRNLSVADFLNGSIEEGN